MSELLRIWNNNQLLLGGSPPPPFTIPNNPSAKTLKINNQSRYWLLLSNSASVNIDRIEPFSFLTMPIQNDITLSVDVSMNLSSALIPDNQYVEYSSMSSIVAYQKGSIQFSGTSLNDVSSIYNGIGFYTFPAGQTSNDIEFSFLPPKSMVDFHKAYIMIQSSSGISYNLTTASTGTQFVPDSVTYLPGVPTYTPTKLGTNTWVISGAPMIANVITMTLTVNSALSNPDPLDIFYLVDAADTAIETLPGQGVAVQPNSTNMLDASGTITLANVSQQVLANDTSNMRRYILFQNLSDTDMWINFGSPATVGAFGSIWVAPAGGSISFEAGFCPVDALSVICSAANKYFTLKYVQ